MTIKRLTFYASLIILAVFITGLVLFSIFLQFAPGFIEKKILPDLAEKVGIDIVSVKIRNIKTGGAELFDIKIGNDQKEDLKIDSIRIDYSLSGLLNRIIDHVEINGMHLTFEYLNNNLSIKGLAGLTTAKEGDKRASEKTSPPFVINSLNIDNSVTKLFYKNKSLKFPFRFIATSFSQHILPKDIELTLYPGGDEITISGKIAKSDNILLSLISDDLSLGLFEEFLIDYVPVNMKGKTDIRLSSHLSLTSLGLTDISAFLLLDNFEIKYSDIYLKNPDENNPIEVLIESEDAMKWQYKCSRVLAFYSSQSAEIDVTGNINFSGDAVNGNIMAKTNFTDNKKIPAILWDISAIQEQDKPLRIQLKGEPVRTGTAETFQIEAYGLRLEGKSPEIQIHAEYENNIISYYYNLGLKNLKAHNNKLNFSAPLVSVKGEARYVPEKGGQANSSFSIESSKTIFSGFDLKAEIPEPVIKGSIEYDDKSGINTNARLIFKKGSISGSGDAIKVKGLSGSIPVVWPFNKKGEPGKLSAESISYKNFLTGPFEAEMVQEGSKISLNGNMLWSLLPDMNILLTADTTLDPMFEKISLQVQIPQYQPEDDIDLKRFIPELKGTYLNGKFKMRSDISFASSGLKTEAYLEMSDGRVSNFENNLSLENISFGLKLEDLLSMRSAPSQKLNIDKISYGDIIASNFNMDFRIDPGVFLFAEKIRFKWSEGYINTLSFIITPEKKEYNITLLCDRLNLAQVLNQFGAATATGEGTVNGKIPLRFSDGHLTFEDGFLYSTPGSGGKIHLKNTSLLTAGLRPGSTEYTQIDIAREALKDFDYSWVKLQLDNEGEDLLMKLQFDGKPANRLPFVYNRDTGSFIRIEGKGEGSNFQGLRLDVNFRLPLDQILNYKGIFDMIN